MNRDTLEEWLSHVVVIPPGCWENEDGPEDWFAVANDSGIIAYFGNEEHACFFRLAYINAQMCELKEKPRKKGKK